MNSITHWGPFQNLSTLHEQVNQMVLGADLQGIDEKDLDVRVDNNTLTIRGERKFEQQVKEDNSLRIGRTYGSFSRTFGLPNSVNTEAIKAEYKNGVLTVEMPKRAESRPKQVKVNVTTNSNN